MFVILCHNLVLLFVGLSVRRLRGRPSAKLANPLFVLLVGFVVRPVGEFIRTFYFVVIILLVVVVLYLSVHIDVYLDEVIRIFRLDTGITG